MTTARVREYGASVLSGRCDACHQVMDARRLNVWIDHGTGRVGILCGPCFVDGDA